MAWAWTRKSCRDCYVPLREGFDKIIRAYLRRPQLRTVRDIGMRFSSTCRTLFFPPRRSSVQGQANDLNLDSPPTGGFPYPVDAGRPTQCLCLFRHGTRPWTPGGPSPGMGAEHTKVDQAAIEYSSERPPMPTCAHCIRLPRVLVSQLPPSPILFLISHSSIRPS